MNKKFTKQLDALETLSSLDFINQTTQVGLLIQQPVYQQILSINYGRNLDYYFKAGMKIQSSKNMKIFTPQPTDKPFRPNLYLTKAGQMIFPVICDCGQNPLILEKIPNIKINPMMLY